MFKGLSFGHFPGHPLKISAKAKDFGQPFQHHYRNRFFTPCQHIMAFFNQAVIDGIIGLGTIKLEETEWLLITNFYGLIIHVIFPGLPGADKPQPKSFLFTAAYAEYAEMLFIFYNKHLYPATSAFSAPQKNILPGNGSISRVN